MYSRQAVPIVYPHSFSLNSNHWAILTGLLTAELFLTWLDTINHSNLPFNKYLKNLQPATCCLNSPSSLHYISDPPVRWNLSRRGNSKRLVWDMFSEFITIHWNDFSNAAFAISNKTQPDVMIYRPFHFSNLVNGVYVSFVLSLLLSLVFCITIPMNQSREYCSSEDRW